MLQRKKYCLDCFAVMEAELEVCPACQFKQPSTYDHLYLRPPFRLNNQYIIGRVLGHGGFAITYLALDRALNTKVAIKEYFPAEFATRANDGVNITPYAGQKSELFKLGREKFIAEARLLSTLRNSNIIRIRHFFEECHTAYFVMEYLEGATLTEYLAQRGGKIPFAEAKEILLPMLDALEEVHEKNCFHRDIKPDNIYMSKNGTPILLDFGAARQHMSGATTNLLAFLTPGFAPAEQYSTNGIQGPWTDIYAFAATMYYAITGIVPPVPQDRALGETDLIPPSEMGVEISPGDEQWLLSALNIKWSQRPENVTAWRDLLQNSHAETSTESLKLSQEENFIKIAILPRLMSRFLTPEAESEIYEAASFMDISKERVTDLIEQTLQSTGSTRRNPEEEKRLAEEKRKELEETLRKQADEDNRRKAEQAKKEQAEREEKARREAEEKRRRIEEEKERKREEAEKRKRLAIEAQRQKAEQERRRKQEELERLKNSDEIILDDTENVLLEMQAKALAKEKGISFIEAIRELTQDSMISKVDAPSGETPEEPSKARSQPEHSSPAEPVKTTEPETFEPEVSNEHENIPSKITNSLGIDFVLVKPYEIVNGHKTPKVFQLAKGYHVTLTRPYYMQTTLVTQGQWQMVMGNNPAHFQGDQWLPVENVSWNDVQTFLERLNTLKEGFYRLPSEAEWEFACRGVASTLFFFGDNETHLDDFAWFNENSQEKTHRVGLKTPNHMGLYDMYGNLWEWVQDRFGPYPEGTFKDPPGSETGASRVSRGGAWNLPARYCQMGSRNYESPETGKNNMGFRILMEVPS